MIKPTNDNSAIAVIQTKMERMQLDLADIKEILKDGYATKESVSLLENEITMLKSSNLFWRIASPVIAAIISGVFMFLFLQYLENL